MINVNCHYFDHQYDFYINLLRRFGSVHSISKYTLDAEIMDNIYDSIYPLNFLSKFNSALDIGSGAGFPSLFLSLHSGVPFTLLEPNNKKCSFLELAALSMGIKVEALRIRLENFHGYKFDLITARAINISPPFRLLNEGGEILFYKSLRDKGGAILEGIKGDFFKYSEYVRGDRLYCLFST